MSNKATTLFFLYCVCWVVCSNSLAVEFAGGTGESDAPYQIDTSEQLIYIGQNPNLDDKHYILIADIDLDPTLPGEQLFSNAVVSEFNGTFEGNGFVIHNLTIEGQGFLGLFGRLHEGATVQNLGLVDARLTGSGDSIGILAGTNAGTIINCHSTGFVSGDTQVGGLVGENPRGNIVDCYSLSTVQGEKSIGGLIGSNQSPVEQRGRGMSILPSAGIVNCHSHGSVSGLYEVGGLIGASHGPGPVNTSYSDCTVMGYDNVGGLIGFNHAHVSDCYSRGVTEGDDFVGGLIGDNQGVIDNCYSVTVVSGEDYVGGLVGHADMRDIRNSFWDIERSTQPQSAGGVGLTTAQMMDPYWYGLNGWANDSNWILDQDMDYPHLVWEMTPGQPILEPVIDWLDGSGRADDPYQVATADQLILISKASLLWDRHFVLSGDIDLDPDKPGNHIFTSAVIPEFSGTFDGRNFAITNLAIMGEHYLGFFGSVQRSAQIHQLGIVNAQVTGTGDTIGCLAGYNQGSIHDCFASATVNGYRDGGGLVGTNSGSITACNSAGSVTGYDEVGGFVGRNGESITDCYTSAVVHADRDTGGFVGRNDERIENCYSVGSVSGGGIWWFVGSDRGDIINCFWELPPSNVTYTGGATSLSTDEMTTRSTFTRAGWDFTAIWTICEGSSYPRMQWEEVQCDDENG